MILVCWASRVFRMTCAKSRRALNKIRQAAPAIEMFCYRVRKYIGAYMAVLGRTDAIAFGGGIGEHSDSARELVCSGLDALGTIVDPEGNRRANGRETRSVQSTRPSHFTWCRWTKSCTSRAPQPVCCLSKASQTVDIGCPHSAFPAKDAGLTWSINRKRVGI
jgi:Acetokinase family